MIMCDIKVRNTRRCPINSFIQQIRIPLAAFSFIAITGCTSFFPEISPPAGIPTEAKRLSVAMIARDYRCDPSVIAVDREGRSALVKVTIRSDGARHIFSIPDLDVRRYIEPGEEVTVEFLAERSGVFKYGCTRFPWVGPFDHKGKLAIK